MPDWLSSGLKYAAFVFVVTWLWRRLKRHTIRDSNAKHGAKVDSRGFFGFRR